MLLSQIGAASSFSIITLTANYDVICVNCVLVHFDHMTLGIPKKVASSSTFFNCGKFFETEQTRMIYTRTVHLGHVTQDFLDLKFQSISEPSYGAFLVIFGVTGPTSSFQKIMVL